MPRRPAEYRRIHKEADKIEPRVARAVTRFAARLREKVKTGALEEAIARKDVRAASQAIAELPIEDTLEPSAAILVDAFIKGGKLAADDVPPKES